MLESMNFSAVWFVWSSPLRVKDVVDGALRRGDYNNKRTD